MHLTNRFRYVIAKLDYIRPYPLDHQFLGINIAAGSGVE